jgi:hypothetical protein
MNSESISTNSKMKLRRLLNTKRVICEMKMTAQDLKVEFNKDVKSLRKKNQTEKQKS